MTLNVVNSYENMLDSYKINFRNRDKDFIVRHRNLEYQPKRAIPSIENVFAFFERGYIVDYKTK